MSKESCSDQSASYDSRSETSSNVSSFQNAKAAVEKSVSKLTSKNKIFQHIKDHLQPLYRNDSKNVLEIYKSMMKQLESMIKEEIDEIFDSSNLEQLLDGLDSIKQENKNSQRTWRPSGKPEEDLVAHIQESSQKELEHLEKVHAVLLSRNKLLNDHVQRASATTASSMKAIDNSWQEWERASSVLSKDTRDEIIKTINSYPEVNVLEEGC